MAVLLESGTYLKKSLDDVNTYFFVDDLFKFEESFVKDRRRGLLKIYPTLTSLFELYSVAPLKFFERANILSSHLGSNSPATSFKCEELYFRIDEVRPLLIDFYDSFIDEINSINAKRFNEGGLTLDKIVLGKIYQRVSSPSSVEELSNSFWDLYVAFLKNIPFKDDYCSFFGDLAIRSSNSTDLRVSYSNNFNLHANSHLRGVVSNLDSECNVFEFVGEELFFLKSEYHDALSEFRLNLFK